MSAVRTRALCLCCGSYYDAKRDCPRSGDDQHNLSLALEVSRLLLQQGNEHPDKQDVREALHELGYR
jgi:hypothetical protein